MAGKDHTAVVIPVYNQPLRLREVVSRSLEQGYSVLVVDDGSDEPVTLDGLPAEIIRHDRNLGKGAAIMTAARHLKNEGITHIITLDADGQHYPEDLPELLKAVEEHPESVIIGVRDFESCNCPGSSRFGRAFGNFWVRLQTGTRVLDIQSGFRAYPVAALEAVKCRSKGYAFEVEFIVRALWGGLDVHHADVRVHYPRPEHHISHFDRLGDNLRLTLLNTHLTLRALVPWPHRKLADAGKPVSVLHPLRSIRALLSERATRRELGFAVALGVFLGAVPLIAFHTMAILIAAAFLRLNRVAAVAASQLCMPPVVPALCIEVGFFMRYGRFLTLSGVDDLQGASFLQIGHMGLQRLLEWLLGSLVVGTVLAVVLGFMTYAVARVLERARNGR